MKKKRWIAILLAVAAAAGLFYGAGSVFAAGRRKTVVVIPAADINYSYGDYENSMEGMVTTGASQDVYLLDTQTVAEVLVESGQKVREGDVLLKYDATQTAINLDKEILNRDKLDLQLEVAQKNLETLMKIRPGSDGGDIPFIPFPEPVIPEEPELPEVDAAEKLDDDAEAYNQAKDSKEDPLGTEANPYRYLCKEETVITGAFLNKLRQKALDRSGASEDPEKVQPMYFVLEVREGNKSSGRLQKGWIMDAATLEKAPDNWQGSVNLRGDVPKSGSDAKAVSRLDAGAEPYNLAEDSEEDPLGSDTNPYRYLCTADAVITSAFLREAAEKTGPDGTPAYYVLEVREGDRADGELRLSWKRQGAPEGEYKEDGEYKLALTLAEVEKEEPGTDPEEPADPEDPENPGEGGQGGQPGQGGQEGGDPGTDPGTDTPGGDPGSQEPGQGGGQEGSGTEQPAQEGGSEPAAPAGGTEPAPAPATEEPGTEVTGTAMRGASARSTTLVMDVTGSQRILFRLADGDTTGLISPDAFYTKEDLEQARQDARRSIQSLQLDLREADINIQAARRALEEGDVKAVMDGTITTVSDPENPPSWQNTAKPLLTYNAMKTTLEQIIEERKMSVSNEVLEKALDDLMALTVTYNSKEQWYLPIREILQYDIGLPRDYISGHYMVNTFVTYLADIYWTPNETIMCAIGQSITQVTPIAVARYVSAIVNGGTVYDAQIVDKIIGPDGQIVLEKQPVIANVIDTDPAYYAAIRKGMEEVTDEVAGGTASKYFREARYKIAAKTGTSQRTQLDVENNSWMVAYAPADDPKIVVICYIQNGYSGAYSSPAVIRTIEYYLDSLQYTESTTAANDFTWAE